MNGPKVHFIMPWNHKLSFWYKLWYARASRSEKARTTTDCYTSGEMESIFWVIS